MHRSITFFGHHLFRVFPIVKPINKACCKVINTNELMNQSLIVDFFGHVDVSQIGYKVVLV
jgi:hypothetical protein